MMISKWKNFFGLHGLYKNISALQGLNYILLWKQSLAWVAQMPAAS